jgi:two-component system, NarL family, sensor kinase
MWSDWKFAAQDTVRRVRAGRGGEHLGGSAFGGLAEAIRELAKQSRDCEGFACQVKAVQEPLPLLSPMCALLYRAVRELLVNVTKHAGADNVEITLDRDERDIRICVADDGRGFDPSVLESARADGVLEFRTFANG